MQYLKKTLAVVRDLVLGCPKDIKELGCCGVVTCLPPSAIGEVWSSK